MSIGPVVLTLISVGPGFEGRTVVIGCAGGIAWPIVSCSLVENAFMKSATAWETTVTGCNGKTFKTLKTLFTGSGPKYKQPPSNASTTAYKSKQETQGSWGRYMHCLCKKTCSKQQCCIHTHSLQVSTLKPLCSSLTYLLK